MSQPASYKTFPASGEDDLPYFISLTDRKIHCEHWANAMTIKTFKSN
jgi:hypothetical protein